jgi:hypothetical protein
MLLEKFVELFGKDQTYFRSVQTSLNTISLIDCKRLLVIGKVQSGKTAHFIGLSLGLFDSGCELGIVFSGTKNNLHDQTLERFRSELKQLDVKVVSDKDDFSASDLINQRLLVVCLKHTKRIQNLVAKLEFFNGSTFLIDDESDQASLNSKNFYNSKRFQNSLSATHEAIRRLEYTLNPKYIQITATPACHLLTGVLDTFKPDYLLTLQPHSNYFGNNELFENEEQHVIQIIENYRNPDIGNLAHFLITYLYSAHELMCADNCPYNISAFVHPHHTIEVLTNYFEILNKLKSEIESSIHDFISEYEVYFKGRDLKKFVQIVREILPELEVLLVASDYDKGVNWNEYFKGRRFFILVGGGKLERGFTIEGLITTFITRSSAEGNADTIQQRARFYGSKYGIRKFIKVFMTEKVYEDFKEYWLNERELFKIAENPIRSSEFKMRFITDSTRPCRDAVIFDFNRSFGSGWKHFYIRIKTNETENIFNEIGYSMSIENIGGRDQKILSVDLFDFIEFIKRAVFIGVSDPEIVRLELKALVTGNVKKQLKMILLGNSFGYRERKAILRHGDWIPEVVHQGYGSKYIGDSNLLLSDSVLTTQISFINLKGLEENLLVISNILGHDKN